MSPLLLAKVAKTTRQSVRRLGDQSNVLSLLLLYAKAIDSLINAFIHLQTFISDVLLWLVLFTWRGQAFERTPSSVSRQSTNIARTMP